MSQLEKEVPGVGWGSCPVLHWRRLCWARPSDAPRLCKLGDVEEREAVGKLCSAPSWASDKSRGGGVFIVPVL